MNPPFSNGDKHLLKAIEMQKDGGSIICLLNAETLKNAYSNTRKDLLRKLNELNANIEYIENAFLDAENKTSVEVALIKIYIEESEKISYIYENLKNEEKYEDIYENENKLISNNFIKEIINRCDLEIKSGISLINEYNIMKPYMLKKIEKDSYNSPILELKINSNNASINEFVKSVRYKYWEALFDNDKFTEQLTYKQLSDYKSRIEELSNYDFSIYNILAIKEEMSKNLIVSIEDTILNLFDELSQKYSWYDETSKNIHYYNGWRTNKSWYINKKVIIILNGYDNWSDKSTVYYNYTVSSKLKDIQKY